MTDEQKSNGNGATDKETEPDAIDLPTRVTNLEQTVGALMNLIAAHAELVATLHPTSSIAKVLRNQIQQR